MLAFNSKKFSPAAYWAGFIVYGAYALYKVFDKDGLADWISKHHAQNIAGTMKAETPWVEEAREFFGLIIVILVLVINYFYLSNLKNKAPKAGW